MITLRLFHNTDPFREIDARPLAAEAVVVGRDPGADWFVSDSLSELSRRHCVLAARDGRIVLRDLSSNGVYVGVDRKRIDRDVEVEIDPSEAIHLGQFTIVVDASGRPRPANDVDEVRSVFNAPFSAPLLLDPELKSRDFAVPSEWESEATPVDASPAAPMTDATLLDAFCAGARLDASSFAGQDPVEVMRRAGAIYRQVVLGVGDLMAERTSIKAEYRLDRTTVSAAGNNPFKWAPTQRVAVDLLCGRNESFLSGPAALKASFEDLKKHLLCLIAGSRSAVNATFEHLSPQRIEDAAKAPLVVVGKGEACWRQYQRRHEELCLEARATPESIVNRAFKTGYEQQLRELDEMGTQS
ncbi:MAG TPA: type VI secretion system-associated FHA domain protein TagH [Vitreimonas sp.]|uniref:type VI secretion system-associated FHA domain protein TagH n=1 Tax=Vitreimonas sp. TaxID=3069702 RepID=UPI002D670071|nr:type VI secretion system-associated FHA domain protein TagH [Vitreimonas sp.]HYD87781.1 type VI secretion system-associated FHA domain protein TagH [Vitreimonas sp.]